MKNIKLCAWKIFLHPSRQYRQNCGRSIFDFTWTRAWIVFQYLYRTNYSSIQDSIMDVGTAAIDGSALLILFRCAVLKYRSVRQSFGLPAKLNKNINKWLARWNPYFREHKKLNQPSSTNYYVAQSPHIRRGRIIRRIEIRALVRA